VSEAASPNRPEQVTDKLIALSRNAHRNVDIDDPVDYWYRLGQRDAYALAAGVVIARGADDLAFTIADRITNALSAGSTGVADLDRVAHGLAQLEPAGEDEPALTWLGPAAFQARFGDLRGIDHDFGTGWGAGGDQRICLRQGTGGDGGLLDVYDPTWDEYAVLLVHVSVADVEHAFARALATDTHTSAQVFAALVAEQQVAATPKVRCVGIGIQP
jgi:hypothetical protein